MEKEMKVSIIIPVYNVSAYIERCIESVMRQTYSNIECIIVDDATPDDSMVKCERLIDDYDGQIKFVILRHQKNRGMSATRNTGLDAATGDYIFFIDSDDEITDDCIKKMADIVLKDSTIEMVHGRWVRPSDNYSPHITRNYEPQLQIFDTKEAVRDFFYNAQGFFSFAVWNKLTRKDFLVNNKLYLQEGLKWEDYLWTFYLLKHLSHLYIIPDITYLYRKRPHSITTGTIAEESARHYAIIFEDITKNFTPGDEKREAKRWLKTFCEQYMESSDKRKYRELSKSFMDALQEGRYLPEILWLRMTIFLSRIPFGKQLFRFASLLQDYTKRNKQKISQ